MSGTLGGRGTRFVEMVSNRQSYFVAGLRMGEEPVPVVTFS
jgi:hypothetical protein